MYFNCTCTNPHKDSYANNLGYQKLMIVFFQCLVVRSITKKEKLKKMKLIIKLKPCLKKVKKKNRSRGKTSIIRKRKG